MATARGLDAAGKEGRLASRGLAMRGGTLGGHHATPPARAGIAERAGRLARRITLLDGWRRSLAAVAAGALVGLAQAPFDFPFALLIAFPVLVWLLDGTVPPEGFRFLRRLLAPAWVGWCFGFGMYSAGFWWIGNAILVSAKDLSFLAPLAGPALAAGLALFVGAATAIARQFWTNGVSRVLVLGAAWGLMEYARAHVLTGFPWNAIGYAAMPVPLLMQSVAALGLDAINVLTVWVAAAPALLVDRRTRVWGIVLPVLLLAAHAGFGWWRLDGASVADSGTRVRVVQPAVPQDEKWNGEQRLEIFRSLVELSTAREGEGEPGRPADVVVWPETSIPFVLSETPEALAVLDDTLQPGQTLLAGGVRAEGLGEDRLWFNSLYAVDEEGRIAASRDKVHLVPFGEYVPRPDLLERFGLTRIVEAPGDFTPAQRRETLPVPGGPVFLPLICYEVIFPHGLGAVGEKATAILNITNDAWFGATPGPRQHMRQARLRAVETGLPLVRAANDGVSAVVDPYGRVVGGLAHGVRGAFEVELPGPIATPFTSIRAIAWLWLLIGFAFAIVPFEAWWERRIKT